MASPLGNATTLAPFNAHVDEEANLLKDVSWQGRRIAILEQDVKDENRTARVLWLLGTFILIGATLSSVYAKADPNFTLALLGTTFFWMSTLPAKECCMFALFLMQNKKN